MVATWKRYAQKNIYMDSNYNYLERVYTTDATPNPHSTVATLHNTVPSPVQVCISLSRNPLEVEKEGLWITLKLQTIIYKNVDFQSH